MEVIYVSFYTAGYAAGAKSLQGSLDRLKLPHDIVALPDFPGDKKAQWRAAVKHKPVFLREMLEKHPEKALVWLDADAIVHKTPSLFEKLKEDMAAHFYHWRGKNVDELLSGTLYVRNTDKVKNAIDKWIEAMKKSPDSDLKPEQQMLQKILPKLGITVYRLPASYCIMSRQERWAPQEAPVIQHRQWSREARGGKPVPSDAKVSVTKRTAGKRVVAKARRVTKDERKRQGERHTAKTGRTIMTRRKRIMARRRREGTDTHEEQPPYSVYRLPEKDYRRKMERRRRAMLEKQEADAYKPSEGTAGGVRGTRVTPQQRKRARLAMSRMNKAFVLDGELTSHTVIVMGNSSTLRSVDLSPLQSMPVVGCNRALRNQKMWPEYLVIGDREPYCQERDSERLAQAAKQGVKILVPDSIFDPDVQLRGPYRNPYRRAQPTPEFQTYLYRFGPKDKPQDYYEQVVAGKIQLPFAFSSFKQELVTCQNISGSMLQTAVILGAKRIAFIGIELRWPKNADSHFFGPGRKVGAYEPQGAFKKIVACMKQAKKVLKEKGVEVLNLSPVKDCPWASVWGNYPYGQFVEKYCG